MPGHDPDVLRIGCLGAARIAPEAIVHPAHVRGDVRLAVIGARDPEKSSAFAELHGFDRAVSGYRAVVEASDVDLVYNPLPISLHAEWTIRALEAGKHVLCEKPFAMNAREAADMVAAARSNGKRVIEAMHYRYHPGFLTCLEWLRAGRIGKIRSIEAVLDVPIPDMDGTEIRHLPATGGGAFMDLGCYPLHYLLSIIASDPVQIEADAVLTPRGVDESMTARLTFVDGVQARLSSSMAQAMDLRSELTIVGEAGRIFFSNACVPHLGYQLQLIGEKGTETAPANRVTSYFHQLAAIVEALATGEQLPTEGDAILRQQEVIDRIYDQAGLRHLRYR